MSLISLHLQLVLKQLLLQSFQWFQELVLIFQLFLYLLLPFELFFSGIFIFFGSFSSVIYKHDRESQNATRAAQPCRLVLSCCSVIAIDYIAAIIGE